MIRTIYLYRITVSVLEKKLLWMWRSCCFKITNHIKKTNNNAFKDVKRKMLKLLHHDMIKTS